VGGRYLGRRIDGRYSDDTEGEENPRDLVCKSTQEQAE